MVVRNNRRAGNWGTEERNAFHFPFLKGSAFEISILVENTEFRVYKFVFHYFSLKKINDFF